MKKIGIITLNGNFNYGNRLQNYALETILKEFGFHPETIVFIDSNNKKIAFLRILKNPRNIFKAIKKVLSLILRVFNKGKENNSNKMKLEKEIKFVPFTDKFLNNIKMNKNEINPNDYSYFIVGSDQVWNPNYISYRKEYFLDFAPPEKRISYASSFGIKEIPKEYKKHYTEMLSSMNSISVREDSGKEIVNDLIGKKVPVVLDPTLLLNKTKWSSLLKAQNDYLKEYGKYVLLYFLEQPSKDVIDKIEKFSNDNNYQIIQIMGDKYNENHLIPSPIEFIDLIKNAELVLTDSFHGNVFSIIMHTPFITFKRSQSEMFSRLETLLTNLELTNNIYNETLKFEDIINSTDFNKVEENLEIKRKESLDYLYLNLR